MDVTIPCLCEGSPHEKDTITLRESLDFRRASIARNAFLVLLSERGGTAPLADVLATVTETFIRVGIVAWTLRDEKGKPVPVTDESMEQRLLSNIDVAMTVGDAADELYRETILPLLLRASDSSRPSPTTKSTSRTNGSSAKRPTPLKRSSTSTTPTVATETTSSSLAGVSNSSQSSESAA